MPKAARVTAAKTKKIRADVALEQLGLAESRSKAQALIMAGQVWLGDNRLQKASTSVAENRLLELRIQQDRQGYVGRGAEKLAPVIQAAGWNVQGRLCLDVGASTGGFTEVLLQAGAAQVYAVDVGYGQLHPRLRDDRRVVVRERVNFRHWRPENGGPFDVAVVDVSFISLTLILPPLWQTLKSGARALLMVKPQFELARELVPRSGVVRDPTLVAAAVARVRDAAVQQGFQVGGEFPAGVAGKKGNTEVFIELIKP